MLQVGENLALGRETAQCPGGQLIGLYQLKGDTFLEIVLAHGQIHRTHATAGDQVIDAVRADPSADVQVSGRRIRASERGGIRRGEGRVEGCSQSFFICHPEEFNTRTQKNTERGIPRSAVDLLAHGNDLGQ